MKKNLLSLCAGTLLLCSCHTLKQTATSQPVDNVIQSEVHATLNVSQKKISYTYVPTSEVRRGGLQNCINTAIHEALINNGNADVLIQSENAVVERKGLFGRKVTRVTVTGFPATYTSFESK